MDCFIRTLHLSAGGHLLSAEGAACFMEAVSLYAGEEWSDRPKSVSRILRDAGVAFNDFLPDEHRQKLKQYIPKVVGTATEREASEDAERMRKLQAILLADIVPLWTSVDPVTLLSEFDSLLTFLDKYDSKEDFPVPRYVDDYVERYVLIVVSGQIRYNRNVIGTWAELMRVLPILRDVHVRKASTSATSEEEYYKLFTTIDETLRNRFNDVMQKMYERSVTAYGEII
jgi:hypothetical protein